MASCSNPRIEDIHGSRRGLRGAHDLVRSRTHVTVLRGPIHQRPRPLAERSNPLMNGVSRPAPDRKSTSAGSMELFHFTLTRTDILKFCYPQNGGAQMPSTSPALPISTGRLIPRPDHAPQKVSERGCGWLPARWLTTGGGGKAGAGPRRRDPHRTLQRRADRTAAVEDRVTAADRAAIRRRWRVKQVRRRRRA